MKQKLSTLLLLAIFSLTTVASDPAGGGGSDKKDNENSEKLIKQKNSSVEFPDISHEVLSKCLNFCYSNENFFTYSDYVKGLTFTESNIAVKKLLRLDIKSTAWHEAGHAVVGFLSKYISIQEATIIPKLLTCGIVSDIYYGMVTYNLTSLHDCRQTDNFSECINKDRCIEQTISKICFDLAGKSANKIFLEKMKPKLNAEELYLLKKIQDKGLFFDQRNSKESTFILMHLKKIMTNELDFLTKNCNIENSFLWLHNPEDYANIIKKRDATRIVANDAANSIIAELQLKTDKILEENSDMLQAIAEALLQYGTLTGKQINEIKRKVDQLKMFRSQLPLLPKLRSRL